MDLNYEIRLANKDDITMIMEYIDEDWREGHIMSCNRELFEYELLEEDGTVNMVIAINLHTKRIDGCLGFIKSARKTEIFDSWGTIWKVRKGSDNLLGLELIRKVKGLCGNRYYLGIGLNPNTAVKIHKMLLRDRTAKMNHWYWLAEKETYRIAVVKHLEFNQFTEKEGYVIKVLDCSDFRRLFPKLEKKEERSPYKNMEYYIYRYFCHLIYTYQVYGIYKKNDIAAFFILREDTYAGRTAIRMVDYYGEESCMEVLQSFFPKLLARDDVEYIDFYEYGFLDENIKKAGFHLLEENDTNIIPNYFSPFVRENIDIWVSSPVDGTKFVKGDGDQDRPNKG